jgi:hypothetical protein
MLWSLYARRFETVRTTFERIFHVLPSQLKITGF